MTHEKPLPSLEGSKRFLSNYLSLISGVKNTLVEAIIKGKQPIVVMGARSSTTPKPRRRSSGGLGHQWGG